MGLRLIGDFGIVVFYASFIYFSLVICERTVLASFELNRPYLPTLTMNDISFVKISKSNSPFKNLMKESRIPIFTTKN